MVRVFSHPLSRDAAHLPAWRAFNQRGGGGDGTVAEYLRVTEGAREDSQEGCCLRRL